MRAPDRPPPGPLGRTEARNWRLDSTDQGRHVWYLNDEGRCASPSIPSGAPSYPSQLDSSRWTGTSTRTERGGQVLAGFANRALTSASLLRLHCIDRKHRGPHDFQTPTVTRSLQPDEASNSTSAFSHQAVTGRANTAVLSSSCPVSSSPATSRRRPYRKNGESSSLATSSTFNARTERAMAAGACTSASMLSNELFHRTYRHFEGVSTVFGTVLNYVVLRILGVDADHAMMVKARATIHKHGALVRPCT